MKTQNKKTIGQKNFIKFLNFAKESAKARYEWKKWIDVKIQFNDDFSKTITIIQVSEIDLFDPSQNVIEELERTTIDYNTYKMIVDTL